MHTALITGNPVDAKLMSVLNLMLIKLTELRVIKHPCCIFSFFFASAFSAWIPHLGDVTTPATPVMLKISWLWTHALVLPDMVLFARFLSSSIRCVLYR